MSVPVRLHHSLGANRMKYLLIVIPAVLLGAAVALYVWAAYDTNPFDKWEEAYN